MYYLERVVLMFVYWFALGGSSTYGCSRQVESVYRKDVRELKRQYGRLNQVDISDALDSQPSDVIAQVARKTGVV